MSDMKKLMESLDAINECPPGMDEGGMPPMASLPAPEDKGNPVTMNVSLNASGKEHVADLINMMKNAGMDGAKEFGPTDMPAMPMRMDMERLRDIVDGPKEELGEDDDPEMMDKLQKMADGPDGEDELLMRMNDGRGEEGMYLRKLYDKVSNKMFSKDSGDLADPEDFDKVHAEVMQMFGIKAEPLSSLQQKAKDREISGALNDPELTGEKEGYENEPDPEYGDLSDAIPDGDDLHKRKKSFKATAGGDNPMNTESIKAQLMAALQEKKGKPDFLDLDKDGNKKEPMKKAAKDAGKDSKGSKPKKGEVPPQFKKK